MSAKTLTAIGLLCLLSAAGAQEKLTGEAEAERAAHRARMKLIAQSLSIFPRQDAKEPVALKGEPVLRYADATRQLHDSALWIWGEGRPAAIVAIEFYPKSRKGPRWLYEIASLSSERIAARHGTDLDWKAKGPGVSLTSLEKTPVPLSRENLRLTQIKQLQQRFAATEKAPVGGRIELRPMSQPLYRYSDPKAGIVDGAIMAFANGTNPEVLLILEARREPGQPDAWHYSLAQMTGGQVSVTLDDKEIWSREEADPPSTRDAYVNGWLTWEAAVNNGQ